MFFPIESQLIVAHSDEGLHHVGQLVLEEGCGQTLPLMEVKLCRLSEENRLSYQPEDHVFELRVFIEVFVLRGVNFLDQVGVGEDDGPSDVLELQEDARNILTKAQLIVFFEQRDRTFLLKSLAE